MKGLNLIVVKFKTLCGIIYIIKVIKNIFQCVDLSCFYCETILRLADKKNYKTVFMVLCYELSLINKFKQLYNI